MTSSCISEPPKAYEYEPETDAYHNLDLQTEFNLPEQILQFRLKNHKYLAADASKFCTII